MSLGSLPEQLVFCRQARKQQDGKKETCQRQPGGEWQRKKAQVSRLAARSLSVGCSLVLLDSCLCPVKGNRKQMHRKMGREKLLKAEGV